MDVYQCPNWILYVTLWFCLEIANINTELIQQFAQISFSDCKTKCNNEIRCRSTQYYRHFNLCKLHNMVQSIDVKQPGIYVQMKSQDLFDLQNKPDFDCKNNLEVCQKKNCPILHIYGAHKTGNIFDIGSKIKYACQQSSSLAVLTCLPTGKWSQNSLICPPCSHPGTKPYLKIGSLMSFSSDYARLEMSCEDGYSLRYRDDVLCSIATGAWSGFGYVCCDKIHDASWLKVFSTPAASPGSRGIISPLTSDDDAYDVDLQCFFRNKTVFSNWENMGIKRINFTIIKGSGVAAYMLFKGAGTDRTSWFSKSNLLQSSWTDLTPSTTVAIFSIKGENNADGLRRFFVAKKATWSSCASDIGWFVVTYTSYPCGGDSYSGERYLFSPLATASKFVSGSIAYADRYEIWVET